MNRRINILILLTLAAGILIPGKLGFCQQTCTGSTNPCLSSQYTTYPAGTASITFKATTTGSVSEVSFYYGTTTSTVPCTDPSITFPNYLGTVTGSSPFTYTWSPAPSGGIYCVEAVIGGGGSAGTSTTNGVIDMVGDPQFTSNPAADPSFGLSTGFSGCPIQPSPPNNTWMGGDDQMCVATWPYNGATATLPFGTCEWMGNNYTPPECAGTPTPQLNASTVDGLDETMHTLSNFSVFAQNILNKSLGTLNSTFDTWYGQAAAWIAPSCGSSAGSWGSECTDAKFDDNQNCTPGVPNPCNPYCGTATTSTDTTCNPGSPGRLLNIYDPLGYPFGIGVSASGVSSNSTATFDELQTWDTLITSWLNTSYTPSNPVNATSSNLWCVPTETVLKTCPSGACSAAGTCADGSTCVPSAEDNYIKANATTPTWGDLPHVIACLNYNAGTTPAGSNSNASALQTCLTALTSGTCGGPPPSQCASFSPPATLSANDCNPYYISPENVPSYANWVNSQINFGAIKNYSACLNALPSSKCPATLPEACAPWLLGRTLLNSAAAPAGEPVPTAFPECTNSSGSSCDCSTIGKLGSTCKNTSCDVTATGSYAKWAKDSLTLFSDEQPKFALRSAFLTDIYTRAQTMQSIFTQGDTALHNFFKTCTGCAGDTTVNTCNAGKCADGSTCGAPSCDGGAGTCSINGTCSDNPNNKCNYCANGGPAAQIIYARNIKNPVRNLPNSVIYGWVDQTLPNGQLLPGTLPNQPGGYAHIVKVTAYAPGRDLGGPAGVQSILPWIHSWTTFLYQKYALANRDGDVYVSVQRWDQDHVGNTTFPNGHALWQILFHNPSTTPPATTGNSILAACTSSYPTSNLTGKLGFGLEFQTVQGLVAQHITPNDQLALANAFMLNDSGDGQGLVDSTAGLNATNSDYNHYVSCLNMVTPLLLTGTESHACARYVADISGGDANGNSSNGAGDYSLRFIDCNSMEQGSVPESQP